MLPLRFRSATSWSPVADSKLGPRPLDVAGGGRERVSWSVASLRLSLTLVAFTSRPAGPSAMRFHSFISLFTGFTVSLSSVPFPFLSHFGAPADFPCTARPTRDRLSINRRRRALLPPLHHLLVYYHLSQWDTGEEGRSRPLGAWHDAHGRGELGERAVYHVAAERRVSSPSTLFWVWTGGFRADMGWVVGRGLMCAGECVIWSADGRGR